MNALRVVTGVYLRTEALSVRTSAKTQHIVLVVHCGLLKMIGLMHILIIVIVILSLCRRLKQERCALEKLHIVAWSATCVFPALEGDRVCRVAAKEILKRCQAGEVRRFLHRGHRDVLDPVCFA